MKRKTIAILLVLWLGAFNALYASSLDSIAILEHNALWTRVLQKHADNPASAPTLYSTSLSSGSVSFDYQHSNTIISIQTSLSYIKKAQDIRWER